MPISRRTFVATAAALPFSLRRLAAATVPRWVFLGNGTDKGIYRAPWNPATGELGAIELAAVTERPNYFALHPKLPILYTVNELDGPSAGVSSFRVDRLRGSLTQTGRVSSHGDGPCFVSVDHTGRMAFVANYAGGSFTAFSLGSAGELIGAVGALDCRHNPACGALGPVRARQQGPHLHCATISPDNNFVLACNLGEDAIEVFAIAPGTPHPLGNPMRAPARAGSGPRHLAFHPNGRWVYCVHEIDCTIDLYDWSTQRGAAGPQHTAAMHLRRGSVVSTLAKGVDLAGNTGCEVIVSDDGRLLYTCTRGEGSNCLVVYRIDPASGLLSEQQRLSCGGAVPRYIAFDPSRRWLLSANQGSSTVTVFAHDPATGRLSETPKVFAAEIPMFIQFV